MGFLGGVDDFYKNVGEKFGDLLPDLLHEASNFACELYKSKPGIIYDLNYFNKGLFEKLCERRPPGLPSPPAAPFPGGQCPVYYYIKYSNYYASDLETSRYKGKITHLSLEYKRHFYLGYYSWHLLIGSNESTGANYRDANGNWWESLTGNEGNRADPTPRPTLSPLLRSDGLVDDCGNLPAPDVPPYVAPESERTTNITYTYKDGTDINVPVVLIFPTLNNTFKFSPSLTINAKLGGGDRTINFHLYPDGWYSEPGHPAEPPTSDPKIDYFINPPNPDDDPLLRPSPPSPPADFGGDEDLPGARWLRVILTKFPDKAQYGKGTPNVYFAGWMEFLKGGDCFERRQINFERSLFRFPDGADGFYVQFTNGARGYYITYTEVNDA